MNQSEARGQPDQSIHGNAHGEIYPYSPICLESLMTQRSRKVRDEREEIDGVTQKDSCQILEPTARSHSQKFPSHGLRAAQSGASTLTIASDGPPRNFWMGFNPAVRQGILMRQAEAMV